MSKDTVKSTNLVISEIMENYVLNGDAYVSEDNLYKMCINNGKNLTHKAFRENLMKEVAEEKIYRDGNKFYLPKIWKYETFVADKLKEWAFGGWQLSKIVPVIQDCLYNSLSQEQRDAVDLAMNSRISIITGGAGSGKTTLIRSIVNNCKGRLKCVLCAPTGKAARNLYEKTGVPARTVHGALGTRPDEDFLSPVVWDDIGVVIVDEASMLTLEMFSGIISRMNSNCRLVLIGDTNQLKPVGIGNVLEDVISLRAPVIHLESNHRQTEVSEALLYNVTKFSAIRTIEDLCFDNSFKLLPMDSRGTYDSVVREAAESYQRGENVQVLTPFNQKTVLSAESLNLGIRNLLNPDREGLEKMCIEDNIFYDGDKVMILKNDNGRKCYNGDIGILKINSANSTYLIDLLDGRTPVWSFCQESPDLVLAYAITIHKSQGSEYDKIIMPIIKEFSCMLNRNLLYTAFSRARYEILFCGEKSVLSEALHKTQSGRASGIVEKVFRGEHPTQM